MEVLKLLTKFLFKLKVKSNCLIPYVYEIVVLLQAKQTNGSCAMELEGEKRCFDYFTGGCRASKNRICF